MNQRSINFYPDESKQLHFDSFFRFTGLGQRILIQGRPAWPGSGKTTLVNRLTKEWLNQIEDSKIAKCPLLLRVTLRELRMEKPSEENLSLLDILSMNYNIMHLDKELEYLSEPKNVENLCIILDGLDEYQTPAYWVSQAHSYIVIQTFDSCLSAQHQFQIFNKLLEYLLLLHNEASPAKHIC